MSMCERRRPPPPPRREMTQRPLGGEPENGRASARSGARPCRAVHGVEPNRQAAPRPIGRRERGACEGRRGRPQLLRHALRDLRGEAGSPSTTDGREGKHPRDDGPAAGDGRQQDRRRLDTRMDRGWSRTARPRPVDLQKSLVGPPPGLQGASAGAAVVGGCRRSTPTGGLSGSPSEATGRPTRSCTHGCRHLVAGPGAAADDPEQAGFKRREPWPSRSSADVDDMMDGVEKDLRHAPAPMPAVAGAGA